MRYDANMMMEWSVYLILWDVFKDRHSWSLCIIPLIHSGVLGMWESCDCLNIVNHLQAVFNPTDQKEKKNRKWQQIKPLYWILRRKRSNLSVSCPHTVWVHSLWWSGLLQRHLPRSSISLLLFGLFCFRHRIFPLERAAMRADYKHFWCLLSTLETNFRCVQQQRIGHF